MSAPVSLPDRVLAARLVSEAGVSPGALMMSAADVVGIVARARLHGAKAALAEAGGWRFCVVCGCTETTACGPDACFWVQSDLCSACEPFVRAEFIERSSK